MTQDEFNNLKRGDIVQHKGSGDSYLVERATRGRATLIRTIDASNPPEWIFVGPERMLEIPTATET